MDEHFVNEYGSCNDNIEILIQTREITMSLSVNMQQIQHFNNHWNYNTQMMINKMFIQYICNRYGLSMKNHNLFQRPLKCFL